MKANTHVLGVVATSRTLYAVLLENGADGPSVLRRFAQPRDAKVDMAHPAMPAGTPAFQEEAAGNDFSIQFGDGSGGMEMFMGSEFGDLAPSFTEDAKSKGEKEGASTFEFELSEILEQCREAGCPQPTVVFGAGSADVVYYELRVQDERRRKVAGRLKPEQLLAELKSQYQGPYSKEGVAFLPMVPLEDGTPRYLTVIAKPNEPVAATLQAIRAQKEERLPSVRLLDAEAALYLGLARLAGKTAVAVGADDDDAEEVKEKNSLIVRAGTEDTIVFFVRQGRIFHYEGMRSLTAFDSPETICSRVLLLQDEYGIEEVDRVLLLSEKREQDLIESFRMFFPDADVASMRGLLPKAGHPAAGELEPAMVPATAAALRLATGERYADVFEDVNLLPKKLLRRSLKGRVQLPFSWHTLLMAVLLFCTAFFFTARYFVNKSEIESYHEKLRQTPPEIAEGHARVLQARIDSMQTAYNGYMHALNVLDSLLVGSDQWSRSLAHVSRQAAIVEGIWVDEWSPSSREITINGNTTARDRVVDLAARLDADIDELKFSEIREWPVYSFRMRMPVEHELPEAALYLREQMSASQNGPEQEEEEANLEPPVNNASLKD